MRSQASWVLDLLSLMGFYGLPPFIRIFIFTQEGVMVFRAVLGKTGKSVYFCGFFDLNVFFCGMGF